MASKPKRSETLSIRINPALKGQLTIAANYLGASIASVVERAVTEGMNQAKIPPEDIGAESLIAAFQDSGGVPLPHVYKYAQHSIPLVMQMRLFYLLPKGLSKKELIICETIAGGSRFGGDDPVFDAHTGVMPKVPTVSFTKAMAEMPMLESYADYKLHEMQRPNAFSLSYEDYRTLKQKSEAAK